MNIYFSANTAILNKKTPINLLYKGNVRQTTSYFNLGLQGSDVHQCNVLSHSVTLCNTKNDYNKCVTSLTVGARTVQLAVMVWMAEKRDFYSQLEQDIFSSLCPDTF
jgi:hypothetical protein